MKYQPIITIVLFFNFFVQNTYSQSKENGQTYNPDGIEMVYVDSGKIGRYAVKGFYIGKYEVTQKQWEAVMGDNQSKIKGDSLPMGNVSWEDVQEFFARLNKQTGKNYRLPTETEWEYAAKGGSNNDTYEYAGSDNLDEVAWNRENSGIIGMRPVGTKKPNSLGIYDMSGNVREWCIDCFDSECTDRAIRGGSWYDHPQLCNVTYRGYVSPDSRARYYGFRVVLP